MRNLLYHVFIVWPRRIFFLACDFLEYNFRSVPVTNKVVVAEEPKKRIILDITDDKNIKYSLDKEVTPENVATIAMNFALFADLRFLINELEKNGHKDVEFRLGREASTYIEKLMGNMTEPNSNTGTIGDDNNGVKVTMINDKSKDSDKPVIEALAFNVRQQS